MAGSRGGLCGGEGRREEAIVYGTEDCHCARREYFPTAAVTAVAAATYRHDWKLWLWRSLALWWRSLRQAFPPVLPPALPPVLSASPSARPPLGPPPEYSDSFTDLLFIHLCRQAFGRVRQWQSARPWAEGYLGMVEVSRALMRGALRGGAAVRGAAGFPRVPAMFRRAFPFSHCGARKPTTAITPRFFSWLVGPCHVEEAEIPAVDEGEFRSGAAGEGEKREKGDEGGRKGSVPLTMEPNFEDFSCRMVFGLPPPLPSLDPALQQPCTATSCPAARLDTDEPCHQLQ
ncbi:unnamed protein product [Closterium sp. NIES-64]|nr:unnamed protein product [Closterium sp. NIES-64]